MNKKHNLFLIGGAKGVGKTSIVKSLDIGLKKLSTGVLSREYRAKHGENAPRLDIDDYIFSAILDHSDEDLILDTHFADYAGEKDRSFYRALESNHLTELSNKFDIHLCLITLDKEELLNRRIKDERKRILNIDMIQEELAFNERAIKLYSVELKKTPLVLFNNNLEEIKSKLMAWINSIRGFE